MNTGGKFQRGGNAVMLNSFAIAVSLSGISWSYSLLTKGVVGETSFVALVYLSVVVGFCIAFKEQLSSFSAAGIKVELQKIEEAREDVEKREMSVRRTAISLAQIAIFIAAFNRRATSRRNEELEVAWLTSKARILLSQISATPEEKSAVFSYVEALPELDSLLDTNPKEAQKKWDEIWDKIAKEANALG